MNVVGFRLQEKEKVSDMNCASCGKELKEGANFCAHCGAEVKIQAVEDVSLAGDNSRTTKSDTASEAVISGNVAAGEPVVLYKRNTQKTIAIACSVLIGLVVVILAVLLAWKALYPRELMLDANTIKDEALRNTLIVSYDKDGDGKLSEIELDEVQTLELDSGDDYNYLYLFRNLSSLTVNNSEVTSLDLSENTNLESGDFRNAPNVREIKVPPKKDYCGYHLPDNDGLNVVFPKGSDFEVKYVPKKVEETRAFRYDSATSNKTLIYEQDVQSAVKVGSLTIKEDGGLEQSYNYSYDTNGRIIAYDSGSKLGYDDNNQVASESSRMNSPYVSSRNSYYESDGCVKEISEGSAKNSIKNEGNLITILSAYSSFSDLTNYWKLDGDKLTECLSYFGTNGGRYVKRNYEWNDNKVRQVTMSVLEGEGGMPSDVSSYDNIKSISSETVLLEYIDDNISTASYENGFVQSFEYDNYGNLKTVTSTGNPNLQCFNLTTSCVVEYKLVIGKKGSNPLNFITLPGKSKKGLFNQSVDTRGITLLNIMSVQTPFTQDFSGKFWWDEENIINAQVESTNARNAAEEEENSDFSDSVETEKLNAEAKEVYKTKIAEYAQYQGVKGAQMSEGTWFTGVNLLLLNLGRSNFCYSLYDLNGDGVDELLINADGGSGSFIADSFAYSNGELKRVCASGEKWDFSVCKGGYVNFSDRSGYDSWNVYVAKFETPFVFSYDNGQYVGAQMTKIREYGIENYARNGTAYYIAEDGVRHDCTMEEMNSVTSSWTKYEEASLTWKPITQGL